jgi:N-methylhydantoinase B
VIEPSALPGKVSGFPCAAGDVVLLQSSGGGGYGDPLERDPDTVARDVADGYVSAAKAATVYGVVLADGRADAEATARRRAELGAARCRVRLESAGAGDRPECRLSRAAATHLAVAEEDIVELVNPGGAPVRARVVGIDEGDGARAWLHADALALLAGAGGEVEVRAVARRRPA